MKKQMLVSLIAIVLMSMQTFANQTDDKNRNLNQELSRIVDFPHQVSEIVQKTTAEIIFRINGQGEIEVMQVKHTDAAISEYLRQKLDGVKVNAKEAQLGKTFRVNLRFEYME